jgi:hypothetical protein
MVEIKPRPLAIGRDVVIPLGMIISLAAFAFQFGGTKAAYEHDIAAALALSTAASNQVRAVSDAQIRFQATFDAYRQSEGP